MSEKTIYNKNVSIYYDVKAFTTVHNHTTLKKI